MLFLFLFFEARCSERPRLGWVRRPRRWGFQAATDGGEWGPGAGFIFSVIDLSALTNLTGTVEFRIYQVGNTAANGGATDPARHFRLTNYFFGGVDQGNMSFSGSVVPAPGALALLGLGGLVGGRRRR